MRKPIRTEGVDETVVSFKFFPTGYETNPETVKGPGVASVAWSATGTWLVTLKEKYTQLMGGAASYFTGSAHTQHTEVTLSVAQVSPSYSANSFVVQLFINGSLSNGAGGSSIFIGGFVICDNAVLPNEA